MTGILGTNIAFGGRFVDMTDSMEVISSTTVKQEQTVDLETDNFGAFQIVYISFEINK